VLAGLTSSAPAIVGCSHGAALRPSSEKRFCGSGSAQHSKHKQRTLRNKGDADLQALSRATTQTIHTGGCHTRYSRANNRQGSAACYCLQLLLQTDCCWCIARPTLLCCTGTRNSLAVAVECAFAAAGAADITGAAVLAMLQAE
jgi:hypothetical protein